MSEETQAITPADTVMSTPPAGAVAPAVPTEVPVAPLPAPAQSVVPSPAVEPSAAPVVEPPVADVPSQPVVPSESAGTQTAAGTAVTADGSPAAAQGAGVQPSEPQPPVAPEIPTGTVAPPTSPVPPVPPAVIEGIVYRGRTDDDVLTGCFCKVVAGEHQGRYGVLTGTVTVGLGDGWPARVTVRTRDDRDEYVTVNYEDIRPAQAGGR
jgi:hypothetical protein